MLYCVYNETAHIQEIILSDTRHYIFDTTVNLYVPV